jgi:hypothetical protein
MTSCSDVKKSSQLATIDEMTEKLQSIKQEVIENKVDSARQYSHRAQEIELRIKNNYFEDTIDMELGNKLGRHKLMKKGFGKLNSKYENVISGCDEMLESLRQLRHDIENGDGERSKYAEYIEYEKSKFEQIEYFSKEYLELKNVTMATYDELHKEIEDFSFALLKNKEKK